MKKRNKLLVLVIATGLVLFINVSNIFNNLLNKKYIVDEINTTNTKRSLEGIQKAINLDYTSFRNIIILNSIYIVFLVFCVFYFGNKK